MVVGSIVGRQARRCVGLVCGRAGDDDLVKHHAHLLLRRSRRERAVVLRSLGAGWTDHVFSRALDHNIARGEWSMLAAPSMVGRKGYWTVWARCLVVCHMPLRPSADYSVAYRSRPRSRPQRSVFGAHLFSGAVTHKLAGSWTGPPSLVSVPAILPG